MSDDRGASITRTATATRTATERQSPEQRGPGDRGASIGGGRVNVDAKDTVVLKVGMSCQGCVGAVKRVLGKMEGVESFDIDIEQQKVTVKGNVQPEAVLQTVSKTGKATSFWEASAEPEPKPAEAVAVA
ncbi:HMA domain-containing protein [Forsythia ovata]|uniref:HMA domain-containing protein n=1 Tax=Forsythia ovata TaxID=205694 RepID=A0ABD1WHH4_9LAMI